MDSTFCKVASECLFGFERSSNRLRGGKNTKIHVLINEINVVLTGGEIHDSQPALDLFSGIVLAGKKVLADKAYSCEKIRNKLEEQGAVVCIPDKSNFKINHSFDAELYKRRN